MGSTGSGVAANDDIRRSKTVLKKGNRLILCLIRLQYTTGQNLCRRRLLKNNTDAKSIYLLPLLQYYTTGRRYPATNAVPVFYQNGKMG